MAEHKVPQDVEAEDKLIGPFSFRQFVYLMVAVGAGFLAFVLSGIAIPLAFIPAPVCLFFLVLALPLRKDQPTEIYFAALIKYVFKPRVRVWKADGEQPLVEISNPTTDDAPKTKDLAGDEVSRRLSFLANLSDTRGWSTRGIGAPPVNNTNLTDGFANEAANVEDVMDNSAVSDHIDNLLDQSEKKVRQDAIDRMNAAIRQQSVAQVPTSMFPQTSLDGFNQPVAAVQPQQYAYGQQVVQPLSQPVQQASNYNYQAPTLVTPPQSLQSASQPVTNQAPDLSSAVTCQPMTTIQLFTQQLAHQIYRCPCLSQCIISVWQPLVKLPSTELPFNMLKAVAQLLLLPLRLMLRRPLQLQLQ